MKSDDSKRRGSTSPDEEWFEVQATLTVRAPDADVAVNRVAAAVRGEGRVGIYPVGVFNASPCADPLARARRLVSE